MEYPDRLAMMRALIPPNAVICEIGVFTGDFANQLLSLRPSKLILCDPFQGVVSSGDADGNHVRHAYLPAVYLQIAQQAASLPQLVLLRGYSHELLPLLEPHCLDAIYIDGDHSYEGVKRDLEIAQRLVKPGGLICGHDYEMNPAKTENCYDFGVKRAVDEFCAATGYRILSKGMDGQISYAIRKE